MGRSLLHLVHHDRRLLDHEPRDWSPQAYQGPGPASGTGPVPGSGAGPGPGLVLGRKIVLLDAHRQPD